MALALGCSDASSSDGNPRVGGNSSTLNESNSSAAGGTAVAVGGGGGTTETLTSLHEIGHGFGISDYYSWTGSTPVGDSVMILGTTNTVSLGDQWMARRYWSETRALRYR